MSFVHVFLTLSISACSQVQPTTESARKVEPRPSDGQAMSLAEMMKAAIRERELRFQNSDSDSEDDDDDDDIDDDEWD